MENNHLLIITIFLMVLVLAILIINVSSIESKESNSYGDNVKVSKSISEDYEDSDYIPRSVSINNKLKQNG